MSGSFDDSGRLDLTTARICVFVGKKRSGKSVAALLLFRTYPGDRLVIDVAGDDGPMPTKTNPLGGDGIADPVIEIRGTVDDLPAKWPEHLRDGKKPMTIRYVPDPGSPTFLDDIDHMVGIAFTKGNVCVLVHEAGVWVKANQTRPHSRRLLMHNRHAGVTLLACMPRPKDVDLLLLGQADLVYTFDVPQRADRMRIAETIGWPAEEFDQHWGELRVHEYLLYDANEPKPDNDVDEDPRLTHYPAFPAEAVKEITRWAAGHRTPTGVS